MTIFFSLLLTLANIVCTAIIGILMLITNCEAHNLAKKKRWSELTTRRYDLYIEFEKWLLGKDSEEFHSSLEEARSQKEKDPSNGDYEPLIAQYKKQRKDFIKTWVIKFGAIYPQEIPDHVESFWITPDGDYPENKIPIWRSGGRSWQDAEDFEGGIKIVLPGGGSMKIINRSIDRRFIKPFEKYFKFQE